MLNYDCTLELTHCLLFCFTNIYAATSLNNEWSVLRTYGRVLTRFVKCRVVWTSWNITVSSSNSRALLCANTIRYASKACECSPLFFCQFHSWTNHTHTHTHTQTHTHVWPPFLSTISLCCMAVMFLVIAGLHKQMMNMTKWTLFYSPETNA